MFGALRSHKFYVPLITVAVSVGLFLVYYFFYVARERNYANERAFRLLRVVDDQLILKYTKLSDPFGAALLAPKATDSSEKADSAKTHNPTIKKYLERAFDGEISAIQIDHCDGISDRIGKVALELVPDTVGGLSLRATFKPDNPNGNQCSLSATLDYGTGLRERFQNLTQDYFDDILIATSSGQVLFQKNAGGIRITDLNSLFPAGASGAPSAADKGEEKKPGLPGKPKPAPFQIASQVSNVAEVELAGARYKLYLQPAPLEIFKPDPGQAAAAKHEKVTLVVCGLWRADRLESEVVSIPYTSLIWGTLVLLAGFALLWPLLKVAYMSPAERLRRRHVFYLLSSALLVTALLTVIVLNHSYSARDREESREQLESLANTIDKNLTSELRDALVFMDALGRDESLHERFRDGTHRSWNNFLESGLAKGHVYPYFDSVSWVDQEGQQVFKVTVHSEDPAAVVKDRPYFQDVSHQRHLMDTEGIVNGNLCETDCKFRFDSVYSKNTGELLTILAKPYHAPKTWNDLPGARCELPVQVMSSRFKSLVDPVLPAGFGFAIVNREGIAQIHSIAARSGIEDFFKESRQDPSLEALVRNALSDHLQIDYMGRRHQMFVKPLPYLADPAPALVVFRDANYFSTVNVACFLVFALLAGLFSIPFLVGLAICVFRPGDYPLESLWPSRGDIPNYVDLMAASLCMTLAFAMRLSSLRMDETLFDILAMSAVMVLFCLKPSSPVCGTLSKALVVMVIVVVAGPTPVLAVAALYVVTSISDVEKGLCGLGRRIKLQYAYLGMVLSLVAVVVVLPCFGLFRISYDTVNRLVLQNAQLTRHDQIVRRAQEVKAAGKLKDPIEDPSRSDWDRYDRAVFYPKQEVTQQKEVEPKRLSSRVSWLPLFIPLATGFFPKREATQQNEVELPKRSQPDVSWLQPFIAQSSGFFPSNRLGAELREIAGTNTDGWESAQDGDDELLWLKNPSQEDLLGVYPLWQLTTQTMTLMALLGVLLALWLQYVIRKVFLTDLEDVPPLAAGGPCQMGVRNLLIIGDSDSGDGALVPASPEADVLDVEQMATSGNWKLPPLSAPATRVDHFEFDLDNPDTSLCKLQLLEQLRYVAKKHVILHSTVDPMFYLSSADAGMTAANGSGPKSPVQFLDRWADVFNGFEKVQSRDAAQEGFDHALAGQNRNGSARLVEMIRDECRHTPQLRRIGLGMLQAHHEDAGLSKGQFVDVLLDRADSYYRVVWSTCTKEERMVLYQLAMDGWVNPKNERAIQQLQRRGVIRRGSGYRLMNDSLRRFVHNAERPEEVAKWEQEEGNSGWSAVKLALGTGLMMCGAWLIYAQQDIFQLGIGYLTALGTASSAVIGLTRNLKGKGGAAASG
jgi:hypothetical protein